MYPRSMYRKIATLFPPELSQTRRELMAIFNEHAILSVCEELYLTELAEIIKDFPDYTKAQFQRLLDCVKISIETAETLYRQFEDVPRLASVILQQRLRYLDSLLFLKEATEQDISKFTLRVNETISVTQSKKSIIHDYHKLLRSCRKQARLPFFYDYHIDMQQERIPSVAECREMFENPSYLSAWLATNETPSTDSDRAPLLKSN